MESDGATILKLEKEHFDLRFQRASGRVESAARVREVRATCTA